jgi:hypothetical protein
MTRRLQLVQWYGCGDVPLPAAKDCFPHLVENDVKTEITLDVWLYLIPVEEKHCISC